MRDEIAALLGYDSWAAYVVEKRMAKTRARRRRASSRDLEPKVDAEGRRATCERFSAREAGAHRRRARSTSGTGGTTQPAAQDRVRRRRLRGREVLPARGLHRGLFAVTQELLGVRYEPRAGRAEVARGRAGVRHLRRATATEPFARFYMDLFPRPNKFGHAAAFTLRGGRELPDGTYQQPVSAIVANFTKPTPDAPSLLRHSEVVTFFHEFGHILHQTLTRARYLEFSGTSTERDFVEAPSQMLEHWVWEPRRAAAASRATTRPASRCRTTLLDAMIAREERRAPASSSCASCSSRGWTSRCHSPGFDGDSTAAVARAVPDHRLPVPGGHALPVRVRPPVRLRRRLLRLPVVATSSATTCSRASSSAGLLDQRRPASTTGARSSNAAAPSTATSSCATSSAASRTRTRSCATSGWMREPRVLAARRAALSRRAGDDAQRAEAGDEQQRGRQHGRVGGGRTGAEARRVAAVRRDGGPRPCR